MDEHIIPAIPVYEKQAYEGERWKVIPVVEELKAKAKKAGLWNMFMPPSHGHAHVDDTFEFEGPGLSNVTYCWKRDGNFSLLKVPGRWRVSIYPREDLSIEEQLAPEMIEKSLQEIVPRAVAYEVREKRPYRVHQRIVPTYFKGRAALAGDAAHLNSPSGGMGLNGGVHDAFELCAALVDMLRNGADERRLALYDRRRRPVARDQIIAQADRNRARMREKDPEKRRELLAGLQAIVADRARLHDYLLKSSMIEGLRQAESIV